MLNTQPGFNEDCDEWKCTECGFVNRIDVSELYLSEDEFRAELRNPYRGLSDADALELSVYEEENSIGDKDNIIITPESEVYLLDMNVAKWYDPGKTDDTRYMGTRDYAAPEQVGYGLSASSAKTDIYAVGIMLNEMITLKLPKEEKAPGRIWDILLKRIHPVTSMRPLILKDIN